MFGRLVHTADIERALATSPCARSAHFAMHHVIGGPAPSGSKRSRPGQVELSTDQERNGTKAVDNKGVRLWLGCVIPKRHARRAVTRNVFKRQIRVAMSQCEAALAPGLWLVRLRSPFAASRFVSAASAALHDAARDELRQLFARAAT